VSEDVELKKLLEAHEGELKKVAEAAGSGNQEKVVDAVSTLAVSLATDNPLLGALAPLGRKGIARAFGNSVNAALTRELAALAKEEERKKFLGQIDEVVEALLGQALIQLVRSQHGIKDEVLEALAGVEIDRVGRAVADLEARRRPSRRLPGRRLLGRRLRRRPARQPADRQPTRRLQGRRRHPPRRHRHSLPCGWQLRQASLW
jgi:hypothetical protein